MSFVIVATVYKKSKLLGYRMLDTDSKQVADVTYESVKKFLTSGKTILNASLDSAGRVYGIVTHLNDLPKINSDVKITSDSYVDKPNSLIAIERSSLGSYLCTNYGGKLTILTSDTYKLYESIVIGGKPLVDNYKPEPVKELGGLSDLEKLKAISEASNNQATTGNKSGSSGIDIKSINVQRSADEIVKSVKELEEADKKLEEQNKKVESLQSKGFDYINGENVIHGTDSESFRIIRNELSPSLVSAKWTNLDMEAMVDEREGLSVAQKMLRCVMTIKKARPFYYHLFNNYEVIYTDQDKVVDTLCVSTKEIFINVNFVNTLLCPEITFILLHELSHLMFKHHALGVNKSQDIFNIAGDLYINKFLAEEFKCPPTAGAVKLGAEKYATIAFPTSGLYSDLVDLEKDTVTSIYEELMKNIEEQQNNGGQSGQSSDSGNQSGGNSNKGNNNQNKDKNNNQKQNCNSDKNEKDNSKTANGQKVSKVVFRGQELSLDGKNINNIVLSPDDRNTSSEKLGEMIDGMLKKTELTMKMAGEPLDQFTERYLKMELAPKVRWQKLLKAYLIACNNTVTTYAKPDKRFLSRKMILPGPKNLDPDKIKGIKICVDTSGSIDDHDLGIALGQVNQILKTYKADAELIYWDTSVRSVGKFSSIRGALKIPPLGGGGTDINCIFDYFESKACVEKPRVVVVFTDGYFGTIADKYVKKYKDTIWVIPSDVRGNFVARMGRVAVF